MLLVKVDVKKLVNRHTKKIILA